MAFTLEDKVRWDNLSPSLKDKFRAIILEEIKDYLQRKNLMQMLGGMSYKNLPPKIGTADDTVLALETVNGDKLPTSNGILGTANYEWLDENSKDWIKYRYIKNLFLIEDTITVQLTNHSGPIGVNDHSYNPYGIITKVKRVGSTRYMIPDMDHVVLANTISNQKFIKDLTLVNSEYDSQSNKQIYAYTYYSKTSDNGINQILIYDIKKEKVMSKTGIETEVYLLSDTSKYSMMVQGTALDTYIRSFNMDFLSAHYMPVSKRLYVVLAKPLIITADFKNAEKRLVLLGINPDNTNDVTVSFIEGDRFYSGIPSSQRFTINTFNIFNSMTIFKGAPDTIYVNTSGYSRYKLYDKNALDTYSVKYLSYNDIDRNPMPVDIKDIETMYNVAVYDFGTRFHKESTQIGYSDKYGAFTTFGFWMFMPNNKIVSAIIIISQKDTLGSGPDKSIDDTLVGKGYLEIYWPEIDVEDKNSISIPNLKKAKLTIGEAHVFLGGRYSWMDKKEDIELYNDCTNYIYLSRKNRADDVTVEVYDKSQYPALVCHKNGKPCADPTKFDTVLVATIEVSDNQVVKTTPYPVGDSYLYFNYK